MSLRATRLSPRNRLRALVVDDSSTILYAICSLLEHHKIVDVVGRAASGQEALSQISSLRPDIVLMDADMPEMSGLRAALLLSRVSPRTRTVMMSMDDNPQFRRSCQDCGASAVIYKPKFLEELRTLLREERQRAPVRVFPPRYTEAETVAMLK
ncbi:MAG TPA: response regulator transcription factor [Candidatus Angelobacter sp.]|nr:response regulator transcription factor [Candidatus Angelobacter sp.]